ncbi:MAG: hypothetical protein KDA86_17235 [Planctomycetaceae bacterium]|nr:hypothetical protein [Planctomycetaceae bacterium]
MSRKLHPRQHRKPRKPASPPRAARRRGGIVRPRHRLAGERDSQPFCPPERWHEPEGRVHIDIITESAGQGYMHPVTAQEVAARIEQLPERFRQPLEVVQLSRMTRKRALMPLYGLQWGSTVYLYPIEDSLIETYTRSPLPAQVTEARMYGGTWIQDGHRWELHWTLPALKDFYLNNILIHEIGHVNDVRNTNSQDRERFAEWFAIEYGYRTSRRRK